MENILYEINGIKYLMVEILCLPSKQEEITAKIKKFECIYQGIKEIHPGGFLTTSWGIAKVLVPEKNIFEFNKQQPEPEQKEPENIIDKIFETINQMFK